MAKTSTITLVPAIGGDGVSFTYAVPGSLTNAAAPMGGAIPTALTTGDNTIAVPTGAMWLLISPPTTSTVAKKIKGAAGDTGVLIGPAIVSLIAIASGQTSIILNAASGETVTLLWL